MRALGFMFPYYQKDGLSGTLALTGINHDTNQYICTLAIHC